MDTTSYDVFKGTPERKPLWLGSVPGLERAKAQMNRMAARLPGDYFVFDAAANNIVASVKTSSHRHQD